MAMQDQPLGVSAASLLPAFLVYAVLLVLPLAGLFGLGFWRADGFALIPDLSLANYHRILTTGLYRDVLIRTVQVGMITAAIVVPVAFALSYVMRFVLQRRGALILQLVLLSLFSGYLVRIYAWRTILGKQGLLNTTLQYLGLIDAPLDFLIYSQLAVIVTLFGLLLPLAVLPIYSAMLNVPDDFLEAARDLGAGFWQRLRTVLLPMVMSGVTTAFAFAFLLSAGDFVTPSLVGGMQSTMIGNIIADQFRGIGANWPLGAALAFVTIGAMTTICAVVVGVLRGANRW